MYFERPATENATLFNLLESRHRKFQWSSTSRNDRNMKTYIAGQPIWIQYTSSRTLSFLELPVSINTEQCQTSSPVKYMEDQKTSCTLDLDKMDCHLDETLNANFYFKTFAIIASPKQYFKQNKKATDGSKDEAFVDITAHLCGDDGGCDKVSSYAEPTKDCKNIVEQVKYHIYHDGVNGIQYVDLFINLHSPAPETSHIVQSFNYKHFWSHENITEAVELSGNPGYLVGKPVRAGYLDSSDLEPVILEDSGAVSTFHLGHDGLCHFDMDQDR